MGRRARQSGAGRLRSVGRGGAARWRAAFATEGIGIKAAAVQLESAGDRDANLAAAEAGVREAAALGAKLIVLPEKWPLLDADGPTADLAEPIDGAAMSLASRLAAELGVDLIAGSFAERRTGHERLANTCIHFGPDGKARASYSKIHLFDADVAGRSYRESELFDAGSKPVLTELADGTVAGLAICFDLRFPRLFATLAAAGAEVICLPAAFTRETTEAHWELLLRARAVETGCHVVAANQAGIDGAGRPAGGRSMIVGPDGEVISSLGAEGAGVTTADLERRLRDEVREAMPLTALARSEADLRPEAPAG